MHKSLAGVGRGKISNQHFARAITREAWVARDTIGLVHAYLDDRKKRGTLKHTSIKVTGLPSGLTTECDSIAGSNCPLKTSGIEGFFDAGEF